jgi:oligoribonuclease NrnB/cAMP/cGMP phosphodiesterase (DHH superfamily)
VFITDISVNEAVAERLDAEIYRKIPTEQGIFLIDHHATAYWLNEKYSWAWVQSKSASRDSYCGTYMFRKCANGIAFLDNFVEKVRRYDTWEWKTVYGDTHAKELNDLFYLIGRDRFIERFMTNPSVSFTESERLLLDIESGRREAYIACKLRQVAVHEIAGHAVGVVFAEQYLSELGNVIAEQRTDIDCVAMINPSTSVSWRGADRMDCGQFAQMFGGGGHKNAAGSPITEEMRAEVIRVIFGIDEEAAE